MDLQSLGRLLLIAGLIFIIVGGILWLGGRFFNLGSLPGDARVEGEGFTCFMPIASMIVISIVLTIVFNIIARIINRP